MPKKYELSESQLREITEARTKNKDKNADKRLEALELRAKGLKGSEISEKTGYAVKYISQLTARYIDKGIEIIVNPRYGGNRRNISFEDEAALLDGFKKEAAAGKIVATSDIKKAYEKLVGHEVGYGQMSKLMRRHNWRKVMPRSKHPNKASDEVIKASKKLKVR